MTEANSTPPVPSSNPVKPQRKRKPKKPAKPYPDFPLFPHATRRWAKKIKGKLYYFGPWADPEGALKKYLDQKDDLHAGRKPRHGDGLTVADLCDKFLTSKRHLLDTGELVPRSWAGYYQTCERLVQTLGANRLVADLRPEDFELLRATYAKTMKSPKTLGGEIGKARVVLGYAFRHGLIDKPVLYGDAFKKPGSAAVRKQRAAKGKQMFEPEEIHRILAAAPQPLRSMILLAVNCGLGNHDVGVLTMAGIDLEKGWLALARPKTGIDRRAWLWPETVQAIKAWLAVRPEPRDRQHAALVFLTARREPWCKETKIGSGAESPKVPINLVSLFMGRLLKKLKINGSRNFYALRHTFLTVAEESSRDFPAVRMVMGHADSSMSAHYRERIGDDRLKAVGEHVRTWLFTDDIATAKGKG